MEILQKWSKLKRENLNSTVTLLGLYISWDEKIWPAHRFSKLQYHLAILDLYCHKMGRWAEIPCVWAFMILYQNPTLSGSVIRSLGNQKALPNILDGIIFPSSQGEAKSPTFPEPLLPGGPCVSDPSDQCQNSAFCVSLYCITLRYPRKGRN